MDIIVSRQNSHKKLKKLLTDFANSGNHSSWSNLAHGPSRKCLRWSKIPI